MSVDILLGSDTSPDAVVVQGNLKVESSDMLLDAASRRQANGGLRRALVHDQGDGLTINYNGDYPGGVKIVGLSEIMPAKSAGSAEHLVQSGTLLVHGDISVEWTERDIRTGAPRHVNLSLVAAIHELQQQVAELKARLDAIHS